MQWRPCCTQVAPRTEITSQRPLQYANSNQWHSRNTIHTSAVGCAALKQLQALQPTGGCLRLTGQRPVTDQ
jgi:hypothetical protein